MNTRGLLAALVIFAALGHAVPVDALQVGLLAHGTCLQGPDEVLARLSALLVEEGHDVSIVSDVSVANELDAFDVVVLGAGPFLCEWNWNLDETVAAFVDQGGGLVATGWVAYYLADNPRREVYPGLARVLPIEPGAVWETEPTLWAIEGHPITEGVTSFGADYDNPGGGVREGATALLRVEDTFAGAAWTLGDGRVVYLGPNYLGAWSYYQNRRLLDGSQPDSQRLLVQAIEWAGRAL